MKKYKNYYYILIAAVLITGIALYQVLKVKDADMDNLRQSLSQVIDGEHMDVGDGSKLRKLYYISKNEVEDFILYSPKSNMDANEVLILKAKNEVDIEELKVKVEERIKKQADSFKSYRPEEYDIISNRVLDIKGKYLILIISRESATIEAAINKEFK
jgi:translation elongation factor EF-1beta